MLKNIKFKLPEGTDRIQLQKYLFSIGNKWKDILSHDHAQICSREFVCLVIDEDGGITYSMNYGLLGVSRCPEMILSEEPTKYFFDEVKEVVTIKGKEYFVDDIVKLIEDSEKKKDNYPIGRLFTCCINEHSVAGKIYEREDSDYILLAFNDPVGWSLIFGHSKHQVDAKRDGYTHGWTLRKDLSNCAEENVTEFSINEFVNVK